MSQYIADITSDVGIFVGSAVTGYVDVNADGYIDGIITADIVHPVTSGYIDSYFRNCNYTELMQLIVSFSLGIIFSPFSYGFIYVILYLIIYEIFYAIFTRLQYPYWRLTFRIANVAASIYGWIIGRTLAGWCNIFKPNPNEC